MGGWWNEGGLSGSGSISLTARALPADVSIHSPILPLNLTSVHTSSLRPERFRYQFLFERSFLRSTVKMGAIPEADPDEPVETKPFKFVTGECGPR